MLTAGLVLVFIPAVLMASAYAGYPLLLYLWPKPKRATPEPRSDWPLLTICVPVHNEERVVAETLDQLLSSDYPADRRRVLVISDASTDQTDAVVESYRDRGVTLVRLPRRGGKTAAENEAGRNLVGDIVVNMDASVKTPPGALKALVRAFDDPSVGVASGRDISVGDRAREANVDESHYVGYEMWVRRLETECGTIVGASGCFYAIRRDLFDSIFPEALSRDFASPLIAREMGYRSVSVEDAICYIGRTRSLRAEYRRKVRTMTRGLETLWFKRRLLNPFRYGRFAIFLIGHKLLRWLVFPSLLLAFVGLIMLALSSPWGVLLGGVVLAGVVVGWLGYAWPQGRSAPRLLMLAGFAVSTNAAGLEAWLRALRGELNPIWEPTRRPGQSRSEERVPNERQSR